MKKLVLTLLVLLASSAQAAARQPIDSIVAVVEDTPILNSQLLHEYNNLRARMLAANVAAPADSVLKQKVLDALIEQEVQRQAAAARGISVDNALVDEQILAIAKRNNMTLSELKDKIASDGMDFAEYRRVLGHEVLLSKLLAVTVYRNVFVSEQEVDDFLAQNPVAEQNQSYHLRHILITTPENPSVAQLKAATEKAQKIESELGAGADFGKLAIEYSEGQQALQGGDLGYLSLAQIPAAFVESLRKLHKGEVSAPIRTGSGLHIIKLEDIKGSDRQVVQQAKVRHILIAPDAVTSDAQAEQKAEQLRARIINGDDFATIAKAYSQDGSAASGGELGWSTPGQFVGEFQEAVDKLPLNTLSQPIHTQFGWHLVEVLARRNYDETEQLLRNKVRMQLREQKAREQEQLWLRKIRDEAYVEYHLPVAKK